MRMNMTKPTKWILGVLGTIVLGALGSGFWELFMRDFFTWIGRGILSVITLGITSVRDSFYVDVAKGRTDRVGLYLVSYALFLLGVLSGFIFGKGWRRKRMNAPETISERDVRIVRWSIVFCIASFVVTMLFRSITVSYVSGAVDHFEQTYTVCAPYLPANERELIRSQFAQIRTKDDYVAVLARLQEVAAKNNLKLPKFSVW
jgi:hypothetical protein